MVVDEVDVLHCHVLVPEWITVEGLSIVELSIVSGTLDIVALIYIELLVEDIRENDEVNGPVAAFVFHLVKSVDSH
jgi:hypothetical protein